MKRRLLDKPVWHVRVEANGAPLQDYDALMNDERDKVLIAARTFARWENEGRGWPEVNLTVTHIKTGETITETVTLKP